MSVITFTEPNGCQGKAYEDFKTLVKGLSGSRDPIFAYQDKKNGNFRAIVVVNEGHLIIDTGFLPYYPENFSNDFPTVIELTDGIKYFTIK